MRKLLYFCNRLPEYFYRLKIRTKLLIILVIPLGSMLFLGGCQVYSYYQDLIHAKHTRLSVATSLQLEELVHEIQKERGLTAGYVAGKNKQQKNRLDKQRERTDAKIKLFEQLSNRIKDVGWQLRSISEKKSIEGNLSKIAKEFDQLKVVRDSVEHLQHFNSFIFYSKINTKLLALIQQVQTASDNISQIRNSNNYISLLRLEESAGQERGALYGVLASGKLERRILQQISTSVANQEQLIQNYLATAESDHKQWLIERLQSDANKRVSDVGSWFKENLAKGNIINDIQYLLGYGGLIHSFKNYILRGDSYYIEQFNIKADAIKLKIKIFKSQAELERQDIIAIKFIERTVTKYQKAMLKAIKLREVNVTAEGIDKLVKIDDSAAINAINQLRQDQLVIDNITWWHISSKRISLFQQISDHISKDMIREATMGQRSATIKLTLTLLLLLLTFSASVYLAYLVLKRLVGAEEIVRDEAIFLKYVDNKSFT